MNKEEQKKLIIEIMEADEKDGLYKTNNMAQQTAVEWLQEQLNPDMKTMQGHIIQDLLEQAIQMEKEQIIDAWEDGKDSFSTRNAEQYYNEQYGQGSPDTNTSPPPPPPQNNTQNK